ncbi:hypothetical protein GWC77_00740 [Paraburkholderia sp. NMBU_R16]|uniref:hypothetical protein n=1 Tax=Paraburkholderia sp. NMBU_R16 TaxID=2698676 RepID=UPI001562FC91|nr:hypothetical protein [Paraburkholderia sp. NMBU_R16]NRO94469.1 hypothetical protein [Paraburkholderia sp. NMBU_R16]
MLSYEVRRRDESGSEATNERYQLPRLGVDLSMKCGPHVATQLEQICFRRHWAEASLDPPESIASFKVGRFEGCNSGFHPAIKVAQFFLSAKAFQQLKSGLAILRGPID